MLFIVSTLLNKNVGNYYLATLETIISTLETIISTLETIISLRWKQLSRYVGNYYR